MYFLTHVTSVAAVVMYGDLQNDPFGRSENQVLIGIVFEVLLALGCVGTGVALLPILRRYGESLANTFAHLRTLEAAVILAGVLAYMALLKVRHLPDLTGTAYALSEFHRASFMIGQGMVISVNTIVIGYLIWRSGIVPNVIGMIGIVGGLMVLLGNLLQISGGIEQGGTWAALLAVEVFAFEIAFAGYFVLKGPRHPGHGLTLLSYYAIHGTIDADYRRAR